MKQPLPHGLLELSSGPTLGTPLGSDEFGRHGRSLSRYWLPFGWKRFARRSSVMSFHMWPLLASSQSSERSVVGSHSRVGRVLPPGDMSDGQMSTPSMPWVTFVSGLTQSSVGSTPAS